MLVIAALMVEATAKAEVMVQNNNASGNKTQISVEISPQTITAVTYSKRVTGTTLSEVATVKAEIKVYAIRNITLDLSELSYQSTSENFNEALNERLLKLNNETRYRITSAQEPELTESVVKAVALRENARIRVQAVEDKVMVEPSVAEKLAVESEVKKLFTSSDTESNYVEGIIENHPQFVKKLQYVVVNGTTEEREKVKTQITAYISNKKAQIKPKIAQVVMDRKINYNSIRNLLRSNKTIREITSEISA